jgi:hypothetical protein
MDVFFIDSRSYRRLSSSPSKRRRGPGGSRSPGETQGAPGPQQPGGAFSIQLENECPSSVVVALARAPVGLRRPTERTLMTRYLISFDDGAMTFPEEALPDVAKAGLKVV